MSTTIDTACMGELERAPEEFRVRSYAWYETEDGQHDYQLLAIEWVVAADPGEAVNALAHGSASTDVVRLVVDAQRTDISLSQKVEAGAPWQIVVLNLAGVGEQEDAIREHLERRVPRFVIERGQAGLLRIAVALPGVLAWEAFDDLEDVLGELDDEVRAAIDSGSEGLFGPDIPFADDLWAELRDKPTRSRRTAAANLSFPDRDVDEITSEGPPDRELSYRLLRFMEQDAMPAVDALASGCRRSVVTVERAAADLERWGLARQGALTHAGVQFLARDGRVSVETLDFLAGNVVDDLDAREALRRASKRLLREFGEACAKGTLVDLVRTFIPPAFEKAIDPFLAARLYACASALIVRIARGEPAGCVGEELVSVRLVEHARDELAGAKDALGAEATARATDALEGVFALFQVDNITGMFKDARPWRGRRDQRLSGWFAAFGDTVAAGHLEEPRRVRWP